MTKKKLLLGFAAVVALAAILVGGKQLLTATKPHRQSGGGKITSATATYTPSGVAADAIDNQGAWQKLGQDWQVPLNRNSQVNYYLASDGTRAFLTVASFSSATSELQAYDGKTGQRLWSAPFADGVRGYPVTGNGIVVQSDEKNHLIAFDTTTGKERWRVTVKHSSSDRLENAGVFLDGIFYYTDPVVYPDKDTITGVDAATGAVRYQRELNNTLGLQTPRVSGDKIIVGTNLGTIGAFNKDLSTAWQYQFQGNQQVPLKTYAFGSHVIATATADADHSMVWSFDGATGKLLWSKTLPQVSFEPSATPALVHGVLALRGSAPGWRAVGLNPNTGAQLWDSGPVPKSSFGRDGFGVADGTLFGVGHDIEIIDPDTGKTIFNKNMPYGSSVVPVAAGGHIVAVFANGLYGYN